jgi:aminomethyltransferase
VKRTPLHDYHVALGGRMVEFAGYQMPVWYEGIVAEHEAVRTRVGLFDVSHMGEFVVHGPDALTNLRRLLTNDAAALEDNQAQYSLIPNERGGTVDDLLVYRLSADAYLLVVNASNVDKDREWLRGHLAGRAELDDRSGDTALVALQGPRAPVVLAGTTRLPVTALPYYHFDRGEVAGVQALVSRTGYTGEDGYEIMVANPDAPAVWEALMAAGAAHGIAPAGLGARDSLRLEASMPLYGQELDEDTSALEAGLGFAVKLDKPEMIGIERLRREKAEGLTRRLIGIEMIERGIPRQHYPILKDGATVGEITSGTQSPTLGTAIAMGYVAAGVAAIGAEVAVEMRGRAVPARIVRRPFYKRDRPT